MRLDRRKEAVDRIEKKLGHLCATESLALIQQRSKLIDDLKSTLESHTSSLRRKLLWPQSSFVFATGAIQRAGSYLLGGCWQNRKRLGQLHATESLALIQPMSKSIDDLELTQNHTLAVFATNLSDQNPLLCLRWALSSELEVTC